MLGPRHFEAHAETYERARPPYPAQLWARLAELGLLVPGVRVLELGAGTGQATGPMVDAGARVLAVEPGAELAARLRRRFPQVEVRVGTAEDVPLPAAAFEVAVAATSVHWFDLDVVLPKVHRALVPGGSFAVWRNVFGDPSVPLTPFRQRVVQIKPPGREPPRPGPGELDTTAWVEQLTRSGHFSLSHVEQFPWAIELSTEQVRDLFTTFSNWDPAEVAEAAGAVEELGGRVLEHYLTPLIVLQRADGL
ncbi:class I SAM-dependent methyltransferase [Kineococcus aurantiacus]|uniref:SAM-dependent methyltransferase n=1 Tax=Kineococcus aurantiacus TaxID=37633 RepID=A0A7Y9J0W5_9ACTN|nr:methyltransferase domain-containing protein [Kineococcus aurantiacus]NYD22610.1 SAM-dependent methyltransferase [Kineococcus aurantiacus]